VALACEEDPQSGGGAQTDGAETETTAPRMLSSANSNEQIQCEELPPITVTGYFNPGPFYYWMGGGSWVYYTHAGGGGTSSSQISSAKLAYCEMKDKMYALVSALPITGDIVTGYSLGQGSNHWARATMSAVYQDIAAWIGSDQRASIAYTNRMVNWSAANINWRIYDNWSNNSNLNPSNLYPTEANGGAIHIFANFLLQTGKGNGTVNLSTANQDPQPHIDC